MARRGAPRNASIRPLASKRRARWAPLAWTAIMALLLSTAAHAQLVVAPPARGLHDETAVAPGETVVLYRVGLAGLLNKGQLLAIDLMLSPLATPLRAGLEAGDLLGLRLVESRNHRFGDGDDHVLNTVPAADLDLTGGTTAVSAAGRARPLGLFPLPVGALFRFYFVVADLAPGATSGHALRLGAALGHVHTTAGDLGLPIVAANDDRVVVDGLLPGLSLSPLSLDFGDVAVGSTPHQALTVRNDGAADLRVTSVASDDAWFTADPTSFTVVPGDDRELTVTFAPVAAGPRTARLSLDHDAGGSPAVVSVEGHGIIPGGEDLTVAPDHLHFPPVALGDSVVEVLTVSNPGSRPVTVLGVHSDDSQFHPFPQVFTVAPGKRQQMTVAYAPVVTGAVSAILTFAGDGGPDPVPMSGRGLNPGLFLSHSALTFGNVTYGQTGKKTLRLTNLSDAPIELTSIATDDPQFVVDASTLTLPGGAVRDLVLTFVPATLGTQRAVLTLVHDGALDPVQVPLTADATVDLPERRLNFGRVEPGTTVLLKVDVDNPSGVDVTIKSVVSDNPCFVPLRTSFDIPAGGRGFVRVAFTPRDEARELAHLSLTHNPTVTLTLVGNDYDFSRTVDAAGRPLQTMAVPFGGELAAGLLICLYALGRRT